MSIRTAAVVVLVMAVGTAMPVAGQALDSIHNASRPGAQAVLESTEAPEGVSDRTAVGPSTPSQLRSRLLYSGRELSTFQRHPSDARVGGETRVRTDSLHRRTDQWFALDKAKHVTVSFLWTLSTQYVVVNKGRISEHHALPLSITSGAAIGVSKEYYDLTIGPTRYFSVKDLVADAVGILLATGVILL